MPGPLKLLGSLQVTIRLVARFPAALGNQGQPDADENADDACQGLHGKIDQPYVHLGCGYRVGGAYSARNARVGSMTLPTSRIDLKGIPVRRLCSRIRSSSDAR